MKHFASSGITRTPFRSVAASNNTFRLTPICSGLPIVASPRSANHRAANRADCSADFSALAGLARPQRSGTHRSMRRRRSGVSCKHPQQLPGCSRRRI